MKELNAYVAEKNRWNAIFGMTQPFDLNEPSDRKQIAQMIDSELSPENLHCDGEISHSQAMAKYRKLSTVARQLQKLDSSIQFYEL